MRRPFMRCRCRNSAAELFRPPGVAGAPWTPRGSGKWRLPIIHQPTLKFHNKSGFWPPVHRQRWRQAFAQLQRGTLLIKRARLDPTTEVNGMSNCHPAAIDPGLVWLISDTVGNLHIAVEWYPILTTTQIIN